MSDISEQSDNLNHKHSEMCARAVLAFELSPPLTNQQRKAKSVFVVVTRSKWTGSARIPPTSHPLAAHFPLQSHFIYWENWHPCHTQNASAATSLDYCGPARHPSDARARACQRLWTRAGVEQLHMWLWGIWQFDMRVKEKNVVTGHFLSEAPSEPSCITNY